MPSSLNTTFVVTTFDTKVSWYCFEKELQCPSLLTPEEMWLGLKSGSHANSFEVLGLLKMLCMHWELWLSTLISTLPTNCVAWLLSPVLWVTWPLTVGSAYSETTLLYTNTHICFQCLTVSSCWLYNGQYFAPSFRKSSFHRRLSCKSLEVVLNVAFLQKHRIAKVL